MPAYDASENVVLLKVEPSDVCVSTIVSDSVADVKVGINASMAQKSLKQSLMTRFLKPNIISQFVVSKEDDEDVWNPGIASDVSNPVEIPPCPNVDSNPDHGVASKPDAAVALNPALPSHGSASKPSTGLGLGESPSFSRFEDGPIGGQLSEVKLEVEDYDWIML